MVWVSRDVTAPRSLTTPSGTPHLLGRAKADTSGGGEPREMGNGFTDSRGSELARDDYPSPRHRGRREGDPGRIISADRGRNLQLGWFHWGTHTNKHTRTRYWMRAKTRESLGPGNHPLLPSFPLPCDPPTARVSLSFGPKEVEEDKEEEEEVVVVVGEGGKGEEPRDDVAQASWRQFFWSLDPGTPCLSGMTTRALPFPSSPVVFLFAITAAVAAEAAVIVVVGLQKRKTKNTLPYPHPDNASEAPLLLPRVHPKAPLSLRPRVSHRRATPSSYGPYRPFGFFFSPSCATRSWSYTRAADVCTTSTPSTAVTSTRGRATKSPGARFWSATPAQITAAVNLHSSPDGGFCGFGRRRRRQLPSLGQRAEKRPPMPGGPVGDHRSEPN